MRVISNNIFCADKLFERRVTLLNAREFTYVREKCEEHLEILFTEKLGIDEIILIERAHMTKLLPEARRRKPTTTLCTLHSYQDKVKVSQMQRNQIVPTSLLTKILIQKLFIRKELWKEVKQL